MNKALMSIFTSLWLFSASGFAQVRELLAPAGRGSGQPNMAVAPDGRVYFVLAHQQRAGQRPRRRDDTRCAPRRREKRARSRRMEWPARPRRSGRPDALCAKEL
jgi:hypothetical protein